MPFPFCLVEFLLRNQLITLWEFPCMLSIVFLNVLSIFTLNILCVNFVSLILGLFLLVFILPRTQWASWTLLTDFFPVLWTFSLLFPEILSQVFFSSPSWTLIIRSLMCLMLSQRSLGSFRSFFLYSMLWQRFTPFCLPGHLSILLHH